jgi:two-component system, OmpR family, phosphate regulon sensor histidine kinase PhoR
MRSIKYSLFWRYAVTVAVIVLMIALVLVFALHSRVSEAVAIVVGLVILLVLLGAVSIWTERTLSADLKEIGRALEKIMLEYELDTMPQPRLAELRGLAQDMDTVAGKVRENYSQLIRQRDRLEAVLNNINAGVIVLNRELKIDLINPVAERILGTTGEFALGRRFTEVHHTPVIDRAIEKSRRGASVNKEVKISLPHRRSLRVLSSPIRSKEGEITGVICVIEDITARRRLERIRRDFVANVSHELRTPVSNMRAVVDALLAGAAEDPEAAGRFMADLDRESRRLADIIEDLLVLSRIESEGAAGAAEPFPVGEMLAQALAEKSELASKHQVELLLTDGGAGISVRGDRTLIKTATLNLLDNAIKYNKPHGRVELSAEQGEDGVTISVVDNGIGVPRGEQKKIFERFYRVDKARSRETGGTGLGLSIVKHAAEFHGGSVKVTSTEGEGSTFSLILPA